MGNGRRTAVVHSKQRVAGVQEGGRRWYSGLRVRAARKREGNGLCAVLLVLLGSRGKEEEQAQAWNTAAVRWRPSGARVGVARAGKASRGGKQGRGRGEQRVEVRAAGGGAGEELKRR
jgi:hypothetical protein